MDTAIDDLIAAASDLKTTWDAFVAAMPDRDSGAPIAQIEDMTATLQEWTVGFTLPV